MELPPIGVDILPPSDDRVFKLILAPEESKPILIDLLSAVLQRRVVDVVVRNSEIPPENAQEKAERLDMNCEIDDGSQVDVEMHAHYIIEEPGGKHDNLIGKTVYYASDLHSGQPSRGEERYDRLARTYQITFCCYTIFPNRKEFINSFSLRHDKDNELLTDAIHIMFVELSKLREVLKKPVSDMTDLEKWSIFFRYASNPRYRKIVNEVIASKEALQMAGERLLSISQDERERAVFRSRRMAETDRLSNLATARDIGMRMGMQEGMQRGMQKGMRKGMQKGMQKGMEKGIQKGMQEGMQKGELSKALSMAQLMADAGEPDEKIMRYTGLSHDEIKKLRN